MSEESISEEPLVEEDEAVVGPGGPEGSPEGVAPDPLEVPSSPGALRVWLASDSARKFMPIASGGLILFGALLILVSFFSGGTEPAPAPEGAASTAQLTKAMVVAKGYLTQDTPHTYRRFGAQEAEAADPTLAWNSEQRAVDGEVSVRVTGQTGIVLATKDGATGTVYCIADTNAEEEVAKGKVDAAKPVECKGGW